MPGFPGSRAWGDHQESPVLRAQQDMMWVQKWTNESINTDERTDIWLHVQVHSFDTHESRILDPQKNSLSLPLVTWRQSSWSKFKSKHLRLANLFFGFFRYIFFVVLILTFIHRFGNCNSLPVLHTQGLPGRPGDKGSPGEPVSSENSREQPVLSVL